MSTVRDAKGNILNVQQLSKYSADGLTQDWFDKHPRPVADTNPDPGSVDITKAMPPYEDENDKLWLYNPATDAWDIPADGQLPSEADLDAIAEEERIKNATSTSGSGDDVPPVQLPGGRSDEGLAGEPAVPESTVPSDSPEGNVSLENPAGI